ncbi:hypothetical protein M2352_002592 [Azospirillum fermentarium]|uniref:hypothetical protein n=1 Tax=Azospirillum fermentarium TaxID=1233114 RepID=UPI002227F048|nr:hypothetical protein [Azospirillum fermentarium]MCW2247001.1 hypothetical protein [Azospirillum fermentarium]
MRLFRLHLVVYGVVLMAAGAGFGRWLVWPALAGWGTALALHAAVQEPERRRWE